MTRLHSPLPDEVGQAPLPSFSGPVIGIGASAGGLEALRDMFAAADRPTGMAYVVVQHLDPTHESMLAELIGRGTSLEVLQVSGGERLAPDTVFIIPPGHGLALHQGILRLTEFSQPRGLRRPIDDFFVSLAQDQQNNAACVILSGTGSDGTTGLRAIKEHGGVCIAQAPEAAKYDGMPLSAIGTGLVDFVEPANGIIGRLENFFARRRSMPLADTAAQVADHIDQLCEAIKTTIGHDFVGYKRSTFVRRVERRMHVLGITSATEYIRQVQNDRTECDALFRDLLINVTRFFRDTEHFEQLRAKVVEPLVQGWSGEEELRVWVAGCSSGEEAFSIAMLFADAARRAQRSVPTQIFATDIDEQMLQIAREGTYPASSLADIPPAMREAYTIPQTDRFTVVPLIRDMVRFSNHSLIKDPPFSRVDLVSCRNLLIYFEERLQTQVMPLLHYALKPGGHLFLGPAETIGRFDNMFRPLDARLRLFERRPGSPAYPLPLPGPVRGATAPERTSSLLQSSAGRAPDDLAVRRLVERYAPASVLVDHDGLILAAYGPLSRYFDFPTTRAGGTNAISLARPGLREVIGPLLRQGRDNGGRAIARDVEVAGEYGTQRVEVIGDPLEDNRMLVVLRETAPFQPAADAQLHEIKADDGYAGALEEELRLTRHRLRSAVEELETANEELKSSNEEMMSMNEELQSTNEELSTVNDELKSKVDQLTVANADLRNFFESTDLAVVVLDTQLRVRSFTPAAVGVFPFQPADRGRPLADVTSRLSDTDYLADARRVIATGEPVQRRVLSDKGARTWAMRVLPYKTQAGEIDGASLVLTDITDALSLQRDLATEQERLDLAIRAGGIGVWEHCPQTGDTILDETGQQLLGIANESVTLDAVLGQIADEEREAVREALARAGTGGHDFEATFRCKPERSLGVRWVKGIGRLVEQEPPRMVGVFIDVTAEFSLAQTREMLLREMNHRVKNLFAVIAGMVTAGGRSHDNVRSLVTDLRERIAALGRAHSLASPAGDQEGIALAALMEETLAPYRDHARIEIAGPPVDIDRGCLSLLAMMAHEWATNSMKYGALGQEDGTLEVSWELNTEGVLLRWQERGKRQDKADDRAGFGTLLVDASLKQLGATIDKTMTGHSFALSVTLPRTVLANG
ncbi:CheR family methyltransferase [Porphyrobacter sp. GA68]|uniref:CheR family methyltransferase n=1 Tax=Porphyrobacter sp. GA68 TaxID=2883480 RepID=UPI001D18D75A|nr:CheR family methyltransferase [Porphyrobacter sp. GA68]